MDRATLGSLPVPISPAPSPTSCIRAITMTNPFRKMQAALSGAGSREARVGKPHYFFRGIF